MQLKNIVLSIGTNKGDKLLYINKCIQLIGTNVASVVKTSKVYKTASWGFESDDFYNCAVLIQSYKSPESILKQLQEIEQILGRTQKTSSQYQAREIDIDIIYYQEQIINTKSLQIPHPHMQDRLFVLLPLSDLEVAIIHPILKKTTQQLIADTSDKSPFEIVCCLDFNSSLNSNE